MFLSRRNSLNSKKSPTAHSRQHGSHLMLCTSSLRLSVSLKIDHHDQIMPLRAPLEQRGWRMRPLWITLTKHSFAGLHRHPSLFTLTAQAPSRLRQPADRSLTTFPIQSHQSQREPPRTLSEARRGQRCSAASHAVCSLVDESFDSGTHFMESIETPASAAHCPGITRQIHMHQQIHMHHQVQIQKREPRWCTT
jgi:hypothetical protein